MIDLDRFKALSNRLDAVEKEAFGLNYNQLQRRRLST
jgi:hypothetical protein